MPVMGTDESGKSREFHEPGVAFGVPGMISGPIKSVLTPASQLDQGQTPRTEDVMPFVENLALGSLGVRGSPDALLSAGAKTGESANGLINTPLDRRQVLKGIGGSAATAAVGPKVTGGLGEIAPKAAAAVSKVINPKAIKNLWEEIAENTDRDYEWPDVANDLEGIEKLHQKAMGRPGISEAEKAAHQKFLDDAAEFREWSEDLPEPGVGGSRRAARGGPEAQDDYEEMQQIGQDRLQDLMDSSEEATKMMVQPFPKVPKDVSKITSVSRLETLKDRLQSYIESSGVSKMDQAIAQAHLDKLEAR